MKKYGVMLLGLLATVGMIQAQSLEEIIDAHHEVVGLDASKEVNSIIMKGTAQQMGMEFPLTIYQKRGEDGMVKQRTEIEFQGQVMVPSCYNGESGWKKMPGMGGGMEMQDFTPEELTQAEVTRMEGSFYNWEERGFTVELLGEEEFQGTDTYAIRVEQPGGNESIAYLDQESYVVIGQKSTTSMNGQEFETVQLMGNYDMVEGMAMPMSMETMANGNTMVTININEILVNEEIEDSLFERPAGN